MDASASASDADDATAPDGVKVVRKPPAGVSTQAVWMGYLTAAGSVGRICCPLLSSVIFTSPGNSGPVMLLCALVHGVALLLFLAIHRHTLLNDVQRTFTACRLCRSSSSSSDDSVPLDTGALSEYEPPPHPRVSVPLRVTGDDADDDPHATRARTDRTNAINIMPLSASAPRSHFHARAPPALRLRSASLWNSASDDDHGDDEPASPSSAHLAEHYTLPGSLYTTVHVD
jgi:hypothetical protein